MKKLILITAAVLVVAGGAMFYFMSTPRISVSVEGPVTKVVEPKQDNKTALEKVSKPKKYQKGLLNRILKLDPPLEMNSADGEWKKYSRELIDELRADKQKIFIHYTADWCLYCKTQWALVNKKEVAKKAKELNVHLIKADYTNYDDDITKDIARMKSGGIPTYLFVDSDGTDHVVDSVFSTGAVVENMESLK